VNVGLENSPNDDDIAVFLSSVFFNGGPGLDTLNIRNNLRHNIFPVGGPTILAFEVIDP
jgi:hypothetical protein